jgi:hypothetical protein
MSEPRHVAPDQALPQQEQPGWLGAAAKLAKKATAGLLAKGTGATSWAVEESLRTARASLFLTSRLIDGQALPTLTSLSAIREDLEASWLATLEGKKGLFDHLTEVRDRAVAGARYQWLVDTLGKELFGSAVYAGEQTLVENGVFRLQYLPPKPGAPRTDVALFFLGGFIPYGDRLFRLLPEANLFDRYLERGIPVYLMELVGDQGSMKGLGSVTTEKLIDWTDQMASAAFQHHGQRKLVAQGYCGSGVHLASYLAARPADAQARFNLVTLFVTPLDGKKCDIFAEMVANIPRSTMWTTVKRSQLMGGYVNGVELWAGLDTTLKNLFRKTPVGRFATGWKKPEYAKVTDTAALTARQRLELASEYWISISNAGRWPIPADLVAKAVRLYDRGVSEDGALGFSYRGREVSLAAIAQQTNLKVLAFFGGLDKLVPMEAGRILGKLLGERYRAVLHPNAVHVGYACFPSQWQKDNPNAFVPNPIDAIIEELSRA